MTESEIKKNAPDGATHYGDNDNYDHLVNYFIIKDGVFYHWCGRD